MSGSVAINRATGEILVVTPQGEWAPATRARNPQTGEEIFNDGTTWRPVPQPEAPRPPDEGMRQIGLGTRATLQGLAALPGVVYDAAGAGINAVTGGLEALGGPSLPRVRTARENVSGVLDAAGMPSPATAGERMIGGAIEGAASVIPSMGAGAALQGARALGYTPNVSTFSAQSAANVPGRIATNFPALTQAAAPGVLPSSARVTLPNDVIVAAQMPQGGALTRALLGPMSTQIGAGAGGGLAQQSAAEGGAGPIGQVAANLIGGVTGAGAVEATRGLGRLGQAMIQPFNEAGRQRIAGEALAAGSYSPETLASRLQAGMRETGQRLPESIPTTAQAARDPALMRVESSVRSGALGVQPQTIIGDADFARNASRTNALQGMSDNSFPEVRGATVRQAIEGAEQGMGARVNQLFDIARDRNSNRYPVRGVMDEARRATAMFDPARGGGGVPAELQSVIDDLADLRAVDLSQAQNIRSRLGEIAGKASAAGDNRLASAAGRISASLESTIDDPRWMAAVAGRREMGAALGRNDTGTNATGRILQTERFGAPRLPDANVPATVLQSPDAVRQTIRASLKAIDDARTAQIGAPGRQARNGGLPAPDPEVLLEQHRAMMRALRGQFIENLTQAARTSAEITNTGGGTGRRLSVAQFNTFMDKNNRIARELFEPREYQQLSRIARDFAEGSRSATTGSTANSQTAQNLSVANMIARSSNGLVAGNNATLNTVLSPFRLLYRNAEDMTRDMFARALVDPDFAAMLLSRANEENIRRLAERINMTSMQSLQNAGQDAALRQTLRTAPAASEQQE